MTAKEVLLQLARKDARIEGMRERLQRYRELAEGQRARLRSLPGGGQRGHAAGRSAAYHNHIIKSLFIH